MSLRNCSPSGSMNASTCTGDPHVDRPRGVLLAYGFGTDASRMCTPFFVRSFAATRSTRTDLVMLHESAARPCSEEPSAASSMHFFPVPRAWLKQLRALPIGPWPAAYRLVAFAWWLGLPAAREAQYG